MAGDAFITDDFLLRSEAARELYRDYAAEMPILDYHCHLPPEQIAADRVFENLTQLWLYGDHYKWRLMRAAGVAERYCTGDASDWEKFEAWAEIVPLTLRNPMYHWVHLELRRFFGIGDRLLNPSTAKGIWEACNAKLAAPAFSARGLMKQSNVVLVCTTDDPADSLEYHRALAGDDGFAIRVLPTWRPDKAMAVEKAASYNAYLEKLGEAAGVALDDLDALMAALRKRHDAFHAAGCRLSDHGLERFPVADGTESQAAAVFAKVRAGGAATPGEVEKFKSYMLHQFALMDHAKGWTQQIHFGAMRNVNTRTFEELGPDTGFDTIGDARVGRDLAAYLDRLARKDRLPQTILYNLNPRDNALVAAMAGSFPAEGVRGRVQFGSAWWFLDQIDGMTEQLNALSNMGLLSCFVGMVTDSRSFLSYVRHDYFRRLLCDLLGREIEQGLLPRDMELIGGMVKDIAYNNAARYFGFEH
jgi:glucuronate isomerase